MDRDEKVIVENLQVFIRQRPLTGEVLLNDAIRGDDEGNVIYDEKVTHSFDSTAFQSLGYVSTSI